MSKLFKGLKKGLEEALAHAEGKITLKSGVMKFLNLLLNTGLKDIKRIREQNHYSQEIFAKVLNVIVFDKYIRFQPILIGRLATV